MGSTDLTLSGETFLCDAGFTCNQQNNEDLFNEKGIKVTVAHVQELMCENGEGCPVGNSIINPECGPQVFQSAAGQESCLSLGFEKFFLT